MRQVVWFPFDYATCTPIVKSPDLTAARQFPTIPAEDKHKESTHLMNTNADLLAGLNPAQQQAARIVEGPVLVLAGPGSGKTRLLTHRIAYLIDPIGVPPYNILGVTFTNRAAREMRERLEQLVGAGRTATLTLGTFHSLCARFLRRDIQHLGRERDFVIYDADDQEQVLRRVLRELQLDEKKYPPRAIKGRISEAKNELIGVQEFARIVRDYFEEIVLRCYERYQALLHESNALDFDDLLMETVRLFEQHPEVLAKYHERYYYLLVDEYQDTNRAQYVLVRQLASRRRNLFVVGDEDQSIFGWRGADIRNILQFEDDYPDAQVILLEQNYRSTQAILDIAQAVIQPGGQRKRHKQLWTENGSGTQVTLIEGYDQDDEAQRVADEIVRLMASEGYQQRDFAVMYRTNAQSRAIEEALLSRRLPYYIVGGTRFYERKEVKDVLAYLRLLANPADSVSLERIINTPKRGIGTGTVAELQRFAGAQGVPLFTALQQLQAGEQSPFTERTRTPLLRFLALIESLAAQSRELPLPKLLEALLERLAFREYLLSSYGPDEGDERWSNVVELFNVAENYTGLEQPLQLSAFLEEVALVADLDSLNQEQASVTCITLHQAKGLEYPVVFIVGLEDGILPHSRSRDNANQMDEERRLLYVGVTRARERLYLLYAFRRSTYGRTTTGVPSPFLRDIPPHLLRKPGGRSTSSVAAAMAQPNISPARLPQGSRSSQISTGRAARQAAGSAASGLRYRPGQRVQHARYGEGIVLSSTPMDGDEEVVVNFKGEGKKHMIASLAKLTLLD